MNWHEELKPNQPSYKKSKHEIIDAIMGFSMLIVFMLILANIK